MRPAAAAAPSIKLWSNKKEQEVVENKAELYAIIQATERLEKLYVKDAVASEQYEKACERLIQQFKVLWGSLGSLVPDVERFMHDNNMQCPLAAHRLLRSGIPATVEHKTAKQRTSDPQAACVAECVEVFITTMDAVKLNMRAVDQLCPQLLQLMTSMDKLEGLPANYQPREKIREWYSRLYQKPASFEISEEEQRQLGYDLESAYHSFSTHLRSNR